MQLTQNGLQNKINEIADRIRTLRLIAGYTEEYMAARNGVTIDDYISYETGEKDLDFAFLFTCAQIFNIDVTELIEGSAPTLSKYTLTRKGTGQRVEEAHGMVYYNLAHRFRNRIAEPLFVTIKYDENAELRPIEVTTHSGQECDIVIKGHLKVQVGDHTEILGPNDTIYYDSSTPHGMIATNGADCEFYAIVLNPENYEEEKQEPVPVFTTTRTTGVHRIWEKFIDPVEDGNGVLKSISYKNADTFNFAYDVVDELARKDPEKLCMLHISTDKEEKRFTFNDMKKMSGRVANYFKSLGIKKGDRVLLIMRRNWQYWPIVVGLEKLGAVAIPAVDQLLEKDILYRIELAGVTSVVCTSFGNVSDEVEKAAEKYGNVQNLIMTNGAKEGWHDFDTEFEMFSSHFPRTNDTICGDDPMMMIFTSGSTGYPKLVVHNCRYPLGHFVTARYWHCVDPDGLHLTISDTGWAKSMWGKIFGQWLCEAAVFVYDFDRFHADDIMPMLGKYHITTFCAPPTMYRMFIKEDLSQYDLSTIKHASTAGEAMNPEVFNRFREATGLSVMEGFGQSEGPVLIGNFVGMTPKIGSLGKPNPAFDIRLIDADNNEVPAGETGEICIRTVENVPCGLLSEYYRNPEETIATWHDGYYHTGDLAWKDEDGYIWYVGRADDLIKSSGYRIGPFEIESVIMELPYVLECGVSPEPDELRGQIVKASIVLVKGKEGTEELKKEIQDYVKQRTAPYKYPRVVVFRDELPKTTSGKIIRHKL
ncbi:MAG: AMP-binding protein [Eubacteriales bacterium]|nr:AMP-binding protein [Eubacteriales bacterium]